jgi:hypothetical protein
MPLGNALRALGEPDELFLMFGCGRGVHIHGKLFYPKESIEVQVQFPSRMRDRSSPVVLDDETPVLDVWYFDPASYDEWLLTIPENLRFRNGYFGIGLEEEAKILASDLQSWPGLNVPIQPLDICRR